MQQNRETLERAVNRWVGETSERGAKVGIFEYVSVLTSIIIGLGLTILLRGVAALIQHPDRAKPDWTHLVWVFVTFLEQIQWWWFEFRLEDVAWTFPLYLFVVSYAVVAYLSCAILFPTDIDGYDGYWDYFMSRRRWFFALAIAATLIDFADTLLKGSAYFASLGLEYPVVQTAFLLLFGVGIYTRNERFHRVLAVAACAYTISWVLRDVGALG